MSLLRREARFLMTSAVVPAACPKQDKYYARTFDDSSSYAGLLQSIHQHIGLLQFNCKLLYWSTDTGGSTCDDFHRVERLVMIFLMIFTTNRKHHKSRAILVMIFSSGLSMEICLSPKQT